MTRSDHLFALADERILVLDGAMGTMIQSMETDPQDFVLSSDDASQPDIAALMCNEVLTLTRPDMIYAIHQSYLAAGADIIETNTFGANDFSLASHGLTDHCYDLNLAAAEIARAAVEDFEREHPERVAFVAGVLGPTGSSASFSPSVEDPAYREHSFADFQVMYERQIEGLLDGRVDLLLVETVFDTLVAKAAVCAALECCARRGITVPLMVSVTLSDASGRTLSGQTLEAFIASMSAYPLFSLGLNCSLGARALEPFVRILDSMSPFRTSVHPNAGLPDSDGNYRQTPQAFATELEPLLQQGCLSIVGGCCGTRPDHIAEISKVARSSPPRSPEAVKNGLWLSGWEAQPVAPGLPFLVVGERTNVAGSKKFAKIIREGRFSEALAVARQQIAQGAMAIDVCMDDPMIDATVAMVKFLRLASAEPEVAKVPVVVDSSDWNVVQAALGELQGRSIVNSISLKDGPGMFLEKARFIASRGAAAIVMLFDEQGQADTFERKIAVAERSYQLLTGHGALDPSAIMFDPNVMAIATGIDGHDIYARDFLQAVKWIKIHCPGVSVSGGISNLSFAFRGNDALREAMHAVFLRLAIEAGLDMAIMNPAALIGQSYPEGPVEAVIKEALLVQKGNPVAAREALVALSSEFAGRGASTVDQEKSALQWRSLGPFQRLTEAVVRGDESFLAADLAEMGDVDAVTLMEQPLMDGMKEVGRLFGQGKLFLPHVIKSARVMKLAVDILKPRFEAGQDGNVKPTATIVLATVRGDVHDIGKNIVALVLRCNGFNVIDLGTMVDGATIVEVAVREHADLVGLSGLITPSLLEMAEVCSSFSRLGLAVPILIGGATTSEEHTARKLYPLYRGKVFHAGDASQAVQVALRLIAPEKDDYIHSCSQRYEKLAANCSVDPIRLIDLKEARTRKFMKTQSAPRPKSLGIFDIEGKVDELLPLLNWNMFASAWGVPSTSPEGQAVLADAKALLADPMCRKTFDRSCKAVVALLPARSVDETVEISDPLMQRIVASFTFARMQDSAATTCRSLADYVLASDQYVDTVGMFAATAGLGIDLLAKRYRDDGDEYRALIVALLADRLAEAFSAYLHHETAHRWWGFEQAASIRPAVGFPSDPDHSHKAMLFSALEVERRTGIRLSPSFAMEPGASVCGFYFVAEGARYFSVGEVGEDQMRTLRRTSLADEALLQAMYARKDWPKETSDGMMEVVGGDERR